MDPEEAPTLPSSSAVRLAIPIGDPAGIGPEVVETAIPDLLATHGDLRVVWIGSAPHAASLLERIDGFERSEGPIAGLEDRLELETLELPQPPLGRPTSAGGHAARTFLDRAIDLTKSGETQGIVTAPLSKEALVLAGHPFSGHTEILEEAFGVPRAALMLCARDLRVAFATHHEPLREVPQKLTADRILETVRITHEDLGRLFGIARPRIGVCGLNPHAGEGGRLGDEEARVVAPAIERARRLEIDCQGPFPADSIFLPAQSRSFDAIIALYHDQGTIPVKMRSGGLGFNVTLGLPIVRTSPDHGTAFDIAGRKEADATPMKSAIRAAAELAARVTPNRPQTPSKQR